MCKIIVVIIRKMCCTILILSREAGDDMKRNALESLIRWKSSEDRKPMVLKGARQVGKTWLMKEFGQNCYQHTVYFNFDEEDELKSIFEVNKNPRRIIELLSLISEEKILPGGHGQSAGCHAADLR